MTFLAFDSSDIYDDCDDVVESKGLESDKNEGTALIAALAKAIAEIDVNSCEPVASTQNGSFSEACNSSQNSSGPHDSGFYSASDAETTSSLNHSFGSSESANVSSTDQSLDELLAQLNLRQVAKFEPVFPQVENDDSEDDDADTVHEKREEREEKKDTQTCEEEVQRLSNGSEIRRRKMRTFNMLQNSKQV
ncbi:unnamed protein product [Gongylonema pulchrum]|nr:unnamed protein product [Gongylonema pulchrum]